MKKHNFIAIALATWFGCGLFPAAPGTVGSLAAILIAWALHAWFGLAPFWFGILGVLLIAPGVWSATIVARALHRDDPQMVVVDEVIGQWITLAAAPVLNWKSYLAALLLFRLFDIWKPPPVRQLERLREGAGIIADDVMAGIYGAVVMIVLGYSHLF
ncbi:MAG TPA: phosphatidylglycerophosphatase A [Bryobacteraceae bacterium]|nr:phosphatidylglycerophosphatase A [Bryobacteraceae bacterium]